MLTNKENVDVNMLKQADAMIKQLRTENHHMQSNIKELLKLLDERDKRINKFQQYGKSVDILAKNLPIFVNDFVKGLQPPANLMEPKPTDGLSTSAMTMPSPQPSGPDKRPALVDIELTQNQTLHLQPNAGVQLVEHGTYCVA